MGECNDVWEFWDNGKYLRISMYVIHPQQGKVLVHESVMDRQTAMSRFGVAMSMAQLKLKKENPDKVPLKKEEPELIQEIESI